MKTTKRICFIMLIACSLILSSCEKEIYIESYLYVNNELNNDFLVLVDYSVDSIKDTLKVDIPANRSDLLVEKRQDVNYNKACEKNTARKIYIYNKIDSTYCQVNSSEFLSDPTPEYVNADNSEQSDLSSQTITYNFYVLINSTLTARMTKNTALTNVLFGIK